MAQTGYTPILIYSSSTGSNAPSASNLTNSTLGSELAINIADGKLFYKDSSNAVQVIAWKTTPTTAGGTGLTSYTAGDLLYYVSGTTLSKLAIGASGSYISSTGSAPQWSAPAALTKTDDTNVTLTLGGSPSTALLNAASLTLGWTGQLSVARGGTGAATFTAGRILFGNGTSAIANDSALFWDNTNKRLGLGTTPQAIFAVSSPGASTGSEDPLVVGQQTNTIYAGMYAIRDGAGDQRGLLFKTWKANVGLIESVRFWSGGGVSIGNTTDPGAASLSVNADLKFNSGYGSVAQAYGCRAWVNFNGTGTPAIRTSGNVSSITSVGTGYYRVNFSTSMPDKNYCSTVSAGYYQGVTANTYSNLDQFGNQDVGFVQVLTLEDGASYYNPDLVCVAVFR